MPLETTTSPKRLYMAAIVPPGNVTGDLARYRRGFFEALGEPSARAFPEAAPLLFARRLPSCSAPQARRPRLAEAASLLAGAWEGVEGEFRTTGPVLVDGRLYLELAGPTEPLARALAELLPRLGLEEASGPLTPRAGFFLCRPRPGHEDSAASLSLPPPRVAFRDCGLCLYRLDMSDDPFMALAWREEASAARLVKDRRLKS